MRGVRKADLPTKTCPVCNRPFTWRKKWERVWGEVKYCSDRCRGDARKRGNLTINALSRPGRGRGPAEGGEGEG